MDRLIAVLVLLVSIAPSMAATITVDDNGQADYQTIQQAINAAWDGDTIVVGPGTYYERITFNGRRITVRSQTPDNSAIVTATVIQSTSGSCVTFDFGEGSASVLEGFTIIGAIHGVYCMGTSPTISKNIIRDCGGRGILGANEAAPTIFGNTITSNEQEGIYACQGQIQGNTITHNSAGLGNCDGLIKGNVISGNADAGGLYFCHGTIQNNVIAGNRAVDDGGGLFGCTGTIVNNTIVGNRSTRKGGGLSSCSGTITNNIIAYNEATEGGGLDGTALNTYNVFWTNLGGHFSNEASLGVGDVAVDPLFTEQGRWDANGTPETEDDDFWIDGDYHLKSQAGRWASSARRWLVDSQMSRCIDAGRPTTDWSAELWPHGGRVNIGAYGGTAQASMSLSNTGYLADLDLDSQIGPVDLALFAEKWLVEEDLLSEDLDRNGIVDLADFTLLGEQWRSSPPLPRPPLPNPMTWATAPYATGTSSIAMVATTANSTDGTGVQYYFEDYDHPNYNSGWLTYSANQSPRWEDTGLTTYTTYRYRVKARNRGNLLETDWSELGVATTQREDFTAPEPNPMTWETEPYGDSSGTIRMVATEATDVSGVEYLFECTSDPQYSSGWQDSRSYEIESVPSGYYTFAVRARDKSANQNTTNRSSLVTVDFQGPLPDPMEWEVEPYEVRIGSGTFDYYAKMAAVEATDESDDVEYYFECTTRSGFSSGWQSSREYTVQVGRKGQLHRFRVKARDTSNSHNETGWSTEVVAD